MATSRYTTTGINVHSVVGSVFKLEHYRNAVKQAGFVQSMGNAGLSFHNQMIFGDSEPLEEFHNFTAWTTTKTTISVA